MNNQEKPENRICPGCGSANAEDAISKREYRCEKCNLELAHLDVAANGVIRGIFGWLQGDGDIVEERYRVKSVLGKGGFGATYLIEDMRLNGKRRALKEVPSLMFDEYETTLLSRLNHPSIPDIIDRMESDGMIYLVLEFGGTLTLGGERKQYPNQRIPQAILLPWMRQLCDVLIYLHSQDPPIVHRDLKPDNILLDENGRIMLIDFGIAKESTPATMTRTLGRAATHGFSPPEQAMGTGTDERSDIYALAATFYALLAGENPPAAHERVAGKEIVPLAQFVPDIAPELEVAILQALNLNVNRRQQTMLEFSQALDGIDATSTTPTSINTAYSERTVLLGRTNKSAAIRPPSIKIPSARITTPHSNLPLEANGSKQTSKRNAIALGASIAIGLATILITSYLFWSKTVPENDHKAPSLTENDKTTTDKKPIEGSTPEVASASESKSETEKNPDELPVNSGTRAAEAALKAAIGESGTPVANQTAVERETKSLAAQKAEEQQQTEAKPIVAQKAEEQRKAEAKRIAAQKAEEQRKAEAKRIVAQKAEEQRKAEAKRIAAQKAEKQRKAEAKRIAAQKGEEQRKQSEVSPPPQSPPSNSPDTLNRLKNNWLNQ